MHLVGHIARLAAHSCYWEDLPEVTIPSAAVTDQDTEAWSAESYERDINEDRKSRGLLGLVALGGVIAAAFLGCGTAKADPLDTYTVTNAPAVCLLLDTDGGSTGVYDALNTLASHGLSVEQASEVLVRAVQGWCPSHAGDLRAFVATYGHGSTVRA